MANDKNQYGDTLHLPKTDFPMRAGLPTQEPKWLEKWHEENIYHKLRESREGAEKFILHCGPPYANGRLHMGHALSYILKDFIVRAKNMQGYDAPFVPGWDCHGLPIEWKVEQDIRKDKKDKDDLTIKELRDRCRAEAVKWSAVQSQDWQRFGSIGDWDKPYLTMNYKNEAGIVRELGKMMDKGYLYKGAKSIMWSTVEQTALAEAEIEYKDKTSTAIYVKFPIVGRENEFIVIWTTTPWTMPANKAVAYGKDITYVALKNGDESYWIAADLVDEFEEITGINGLGTSDTAKGSYFAGLKCKHPFYDFEVPVLEGFHVTTDAGTGFVHIAPSHGAEDFQIGVEQGLDVFCHVEGNGVYDEEVPPLKKTKEALTGVHIWKAQPLIIAEMEAQNTLIHSYELTHSYPVSWRSKAPLIFRTTPQWFIAMDGENDLRGKALAAIKKVEWIPGYGENRITSMIAGRPDWCISRQRAWGVPITIFKNKATGEYISDPDVFEYIAKQVEKMGIDAWESLAVEELLPEGWLEKNNVDPMDLEKETDILDVWIDSGTTHAHVLRQRAELKRKEGLRPANLYLEGSDQHRGWFHSSLLTSVATYGDAPYDQVLTHGFVVDGHGRKMSKSLGNGIAPQELAEKYGMDIVRLWVASSDYAEDVRLSDEILKGVSDAYRRFRNSFRWLLGNLNGFDAKKDGVAYDKLPELEKYVLSRFTGVMQQAEKDYDAYKFHKVYQAFYNFCSAELSSLYFDIRKDCLYCDVESSNRRKSALTVLDIILRGMSTALAPLLAFTCDEVWRAMGEKESIHLQEFYKVETKWQDSDLEAKWQKALELRSKALLKLEELREKGEIGSSLEAEVTLPVSDDLKDIDWQELLIVSHVETGEEIAARKSANEKCPRCWTFAADIGSNADYKDVCGRCAEAVAQAQKSTAA
jgi:isoleucyl-tRNA synthetase